MKPNFALTLSFEGIGLLHRAFPGWHLVGEIGLENRNLLADLKELREKAVVLDPSGLRTKLVIPNDQIRYISFQAGDTAEDEMPALIRRNLDGATPYALDVLAFDWTQEDGTVKVAAVARETLREAEAFAREHKFNPISFVAIPDSADFGGEPFFGETAHFLDGAAPGDYVERDLAPVRIIGTARLPVPEAPQPPAASADPPAPDPAPEPELKTDTQKAAPDKTGALPDPMPGFAESPEDFETPVVTNGAAPREDEDEDEDAPRAAPADAPADPVPGAFSSIRAHRGDAPASAPRLDGVARHFHPVPVSVQVNADSLPGDPEKDAAGDPPRARPEPTAAPEVFQSRRTPVVTHIPAAPPERDPEPAPESETEPEPAPPMDHSAFTSRRVTPVVAARRPEFQSNPADEEERMTIFGARGGEPVGGKPKHLALILTAVLLLFLAGVAAWASIFLDDGISGLFGDDPEIRIADVPALPKTPEAEAAPAEDADTVVASLQTEGDPVEEALLETLTPPDPVDLTEDEIRARYAATGIWPIAPQIPDAPAPGSLDEFYQTSIDGNVAFQDAVALPDTGSLLADERPQTPGSPTAAGVTFDRDERGLVRATAAGALTPEGILVYAGRPPVRPAAMPKREIVKEVVPEADIAQPELAAFRPQPRPEDLDEQVERDTLSGRTRLELAALRPRLRPQDARLPATGSNTVAATDTGSDRDTVQPFIDLNAVNDAVATAAVKTPDFDNALPQAVASSLKPNTRPKNFPDIVSGSRDAEAAVAVSATQRVAPRIPTSASVAKSATERNVLKLRNINLIGVYGTPSSRRALVRLSNGRYRKVKVGDRLDGGKVSAIGDGELRYVKSGRSVTLKMPRG